MESAVTEAIKGCLSDKGGPFGCIVVKDDTIVGRGCNKVTSTNDPTAHAEVIAIRDACKTLSTFQLKGCLLYTSCEPCPMCFGAIYWARPDKVYFGCNREDAADIGFDDDMIYKQIVLAPEERNIEFEQVGQENALSAFHEWTNKMDKKSY